MAEKLILKTRGLSRYSDPLSARPEGSLNVGENVVIDKDGIFSPRRGFSKLSGTLVEQAKGLLSFKDRLLVYAKDATEDYNVLYLFDEDAGTFTEYAGFTSTNDTIRSWSSGGSLYFTGDDGVYKLDSLTGTITEAGLPQALGGTTALVGTTGWLAALHTAAYRIVWGIRDANDKLVLSAPSERIYVTNTSATDPCTTTITFHVPFELRGTNSSYFYQVYRTESIDGIDSEPGDIMGLVYEDFYAGDSSTSVTVSDLTSDSLRGQGLYTNANIEGLAQSNNQPPACTDVAEFNGYMFYAGLTYRHTYTFQLLATNAPASTNGLQVGDTVTIAGQTYTAIASSGTPTAIQFKLYNSGVPSTDIRQTAEDLVNRINANASNLLVNAYYASDYNELPGKIRIEERDYGTEFKVKSTTAASVPVFSPDIDDEKTSSAETFPNGLAYSKIQEADAVPRLNYNYVGSRDGEILRIVPLRDSLFILKQDGIWRLTGTSAANFNVDAFDSTARLLAPSSVGVLNNLVFGLFDQGVCQLSESGVSILSREVEGDIKGYMGENLTNLKSQTFGVVYETDRKYLLWVPESSLNTYPTQAYVFNTVTESWTTYDRGAVAGVVNPANDRLYIAAGSTLHLSKERKDFAYTDFSDEQFEVTASAVDGTEITLTSLNGIDVGDIYYEDSDTFSPIASIDVSNNSITVDVDLGFTTGTYEVRRAYTSTVEWNPVHLNNAGHLKQFYEGMVITSKDFSSAELAFKTNLSGSWESVTLEGSPIGSWGLFAWGNVVWGGDINTVVLHRTYIPRNKQRAGVIYARFKTNTVFSEWEVSGVELTYRDAGPRSTK